ncbi:MAG: ABC transporter permease [Betaproteobacteria bacterium]|nr:ABC transporter permease [Betaproteobacteria bacterium]MDH3436070.1 ABC transporter permease [Betaproteobacteria bacterium]
MILTIAGKELRSLFASPLAWVVLTVTQIMVGYVFLRRLDDFLQLQSQLARLASPPGATELVAAPVFGTAAGVLLFSVPLLAMRLIAEERRNQTMVLIVSAPVSMTQIVLGKFLGLFVFLLLIVALTALMPLSLAAATSIDYGLLAGLVAGLALLAASFAAVSLFISCLTVHPVAAAVGSFAALLVMMLAGEAAGEGLRTRGWLLAASLAQVLSPIKNFEPFAKGVLDTYAVACSLLVVVFFLALAARQLDAQRLRG